MKFCETDGSAVFMKGVAEYFLFRGWFIVKVNVGQSCILSGGAGTLPSDAEVCW